MRYNSPFDTTDPNAPYVDENPTAGIVGSVVPAVALEAPQREIVAAIRLLLGDNSPTSLSNEQLAQGLLQKIMIPSVQKWNAGWQYEAGNITTDGGKLYIAISGNKNKQPNISSEWDVVSTSGTKEPTMPIGSVYTQYPNQEEPKTLFGGKWDIISGEYPGLFFRAEGGSAKSFGTGKQDGGLPNITGSIEKPDGVEYQPLQAFGETKNWIEKGALSGKSKHQRGIPDTSIGYDGNMTDLYFDASKSNSIYGAADEVLPDNITIRIWKRTA